ncbi:MAG: hypothetical protein L0H59_15415, partial [Tomitella sp.]|nr:hypothetical protein [Tomitella sp.]
MTPETDRDADSTGTGTGPDAATGTTSARKPASHYDFPQHWAADVLASDGRAVRLRPITPDDG